MNGTALASGRPTWVRWRIVGLLMAFSFMNHFNRVSITSAHDALQGEFHFSSTQIGNIATAFLLVYTLFMTPGGLLIDRWGPRRALLLMGFGTALFGCLTSIAGLPFLPLALALPSFFVIRGLMGGCTAPLHPSGARAVSYWIPFRQRALANGLVTGAATVGIACVPLAFGNLIDSVGWRTAFVITGCCTGLLTLLWAGYGADHPSEHKSVNEAEREWIERSDPLAPARRFPSSKQPSFVWPHERAWLLLLQNRSLVFITLSYAAVGYFEYLLFYWMEQYFKKGLLLSTETSRFYASFPPLAMVLTMPFGGLLSDWLVLRLGRRPGRAIVAAGAMVASAVLLFIASRTSNVTWSVIWFTLASGAIGATEGPFWTTAIELGGRRGGTSAGICNTGGNAGGLIAPSLTPFVADLFGNWRIAMSLGSLVALAGVVFWFWIDPREGNIPSKAR